jgi:multiple sugar transport system ATP-binding protein
LAELLIEGLEKRFGTASVVRHLSLKVHDQEFLTFLGPSGCGKSTILNMVAGLEAPTAGEIYIGGRRVTRLEPHERDIAMVFQSYALYPHKTIFENIAFPLKLRRVPRGEIAQRVKDVAARLGIAQLLDRRPAELSGGERQRVALGRALVRRPAVFLLDEPLSNLDSQLRTEMRAEIKRLHSEFGTTTLYVTHDQMEAMTLSDRIAVLRNGELQQVGTPDEIYRLPANCFVASFVGNPGMNFIRGEITEGAVCLSGLRLEVGLGSEELPSGAVLVGVRPEDVELETSEGPSGDVHEVETLGADALVVLSWSATRIIARAPSSFRPRSGEQVRFRIPPGRALLFDPTTKNRIRLPRES